MRALNRSLYLLTLVCTFSALAPAQAERPWKETMERFEAEDRQTPPKPGGIVFVGSSSIRLWDLEKWFPELDGPVLNRGFGGSQIFHSVDELELLVLRHQPRAIVLYAGDNDVAGGKTPERVSEDFDRFVAGVRETLGETPIYFLAIKPSLSRWDKAPQMEIANDKIRTTCENEEALHYVDLWAPMLAEDGKPRPELFRSDNLHLNDAGYQLWSDLVRKELQRVPATVE